MHYKYRGNSQILLRKERNFDEKKEEDTETPA